jgi:transcriptional regulator with XRE-family HTH domain
MHSALLSPEHSAYRPGMQCAYAADMTNGSPRQLRRRENLRALIDARGGQAQVALEIGTPKSHLSAILAGRRGVGDALAQKIERYYELPEGWFDDSGESSSPELAQLADALEQLSPRWREWLLMNMREAVKLAREADEDSASTKNDPLSSSKSSKAA